MTVLLEFIFDSLMKYITLFLYHFLEEEVVAMDTDAKQPSEHPHPPPLAELEKKVEDTVSKIIHKIAVQSSSKFS